MRFLKSLSFKNKLLFLQLFMIFNLGAGAFWNLSNLGGSYQEDLEAQFADIAQSLGAKIGAQFFERYGDIQAFAQNDNIQNLNAKDSIADLDAYVTLYGIYDLIVVTDAQGNFVVSNTRDVSGKTVNQEKLKAMNFKDTPWFKAVASDTYTSDKAKAFDRTFFEDFQEDELIKAALGESKYTTSFSAKILNQKGEFVGVITNRADFKWVAGEFVETYEQLKKAGLNESKLILLNNEGQVIYSHDPSAHSEKNEIFYDSQLILADNPAKAGYLPAMEALKKNSGHVKTYNPKIGKDVIVGYHHVDNPKWVSSIGWSIMAEEHAEDLFEHFFAEKHKFYLVLGINIAIALLIGWLLSNNINKELQSIIERLLNNFQGLGKTSQELNSSATSLSEASTEQAAAVQETMAAVDQISAMVQKNAESAKISSDASTNAKTTAESGQQNVGNMLTAIDEISKSNEKISTEINHSHEQLSEITKLINEIATKTKVINDIVFQTKLLSFNASVEAARAGEFGKGFAVVAEEVGNLAQMSGQASREISELLDVSTNKVEEIISQTKSRTAVLIQDSTEKVNSGIETARTCNQSLDEIIQNVVSVDGLVNEISTASSEQEVGIQEISKAISQLEIVTQENSKTASATSSYSQKLTEQARELNQAIVQLQQLVKGHQGDSTLPLATKSHTTLEKSEKIAKVLQMPIKQNPAGASRSKDFNKSIISQDSQNGADSTISKLPQLDETKMAAGGEFEIAPQADSTPSSDHPGFKE